MPVKLFFAALFTSTTLFFVIVYQSSYSMQREAQIQTLTKLTKLPGVSLSTAYLETRVLYYKDYSNQLYPKMNNYSKMDYVYAK